MNLRVPFNKKSGYFYITNSISIHSDKIYSQVEGINYTISLYNTQKICHVWAGVLIEMILKLEIQVYERYPLEPIEAFEDRKKDIETFIFNTLTEFKMLKIRDGSPFKN